MVQFESYAKPYFITIDFEITEEVDYYNRKIYGSLPRTFYDSKMHTENCVFLYCVSDNIKFALTSEKIYVALIPFFPLIQFIND